MAELRWFPFKPSEIAPEMIEMKPNIVFTVLPPEGPQIEKKLKFKELNFKFVAEKQKQKERESTFIEIACPILTKVPRTHVMKILIVGGSNSGKSSIVQRYVKDLFMPNIPPTLGVDFALKDVLIDEGNIVRLQLWDMTGCERFGLLTRSYYKQAYGGIVVFDVNDNQSLKNAARWKQDIDSKVRLPNGNPIPCILLANQVDRKRKEIDATELDQFSKENEFLAWFATSAKTNVGINEAVVNTRNRKIKQKQSNFLFS